MHEKFIAKVTIVNKRSPVPNVRDLPMFKITATLHPIDNKAFRTGIINFYTNEELEIDQTLEITIEDCA